MGQQECFNEINNGVAVDFPTVIIAKQFLLSNASEGIIDVQNLLPQFLMTNDAVAPKSICVQPDWDATEDIRRAIRSISYTAAFCEATLALINMGYFHRVSNSTFSAEVQLTHTTEHPMYRGGGSRGGWSFPNWNYCIPVHIKVSALLSSADTGFFAPDLFLEQIGIQNLHPRVREGLYDAVRCFRHELYTPCLAMLMTAIEGAWKELGLALLDTLPEDQSAKFEKQRKDLTDRHSSAFTIIETVVSLFERQDLYGVLKKSSGVNLDNLRDAAEWSNRVRESRNTVHYGVMTDLPNGYGKVATILLGVPTHFQTLYRLLESCSAQIMSANKEESGLHRMN